MSLPRENIIRDVEIEMNNTFSYKQQTIKIYVL